MNASRLLALVLASLASPPALSAASYDRRLSMRSPPPASPSSTAAPATEVEWLTPHSEVWEGSDGEIR